MYFQKGSGPNFYGHGCRTLERELQMCSLFQYPRGGSVRGVPSAEDEQRIRPGGYYFQPDIYPRAPLLSDTIVRWEGQIPITAMLKLCERQRISQCGRTPTKLKGYAAMHRRQHTPESRRVLRRINIGTPRRNTPSIPSIPLAGAHQSISV